VVSASAASGQAFLRVCVIITPCRTSQVREPLYPRMETPSLLCGETPGGGANAATHSIPPSFLGKGARGLGLLNGARGLGFLNGARGLVSQRAKGPISQREDPAAGSPACPRPEFIRVHVTPPPGSAKRCMRRPRISYSNNEFRGYAYRIASPRHCSGSSQADPARTCVAARSISRWERYTRPSASPMNPALRVAGFWGASEFIPWRSAQRGVARGCRFIERLILRRT
jgi:hypothetical protein